MIRGLANLHDAVFGGIERATAGWLPGLVMRLGLASVLLVYLLNSAATKVGSGFPGSLVPTISAYAQMLPPVAEQAGYNADKIAFLPHGLIVYAGTYGEVLLPLLVVVGLFTRIASLGMLAFIAVMTYVDINFHGVDAKTIGDFFDVVQDSPIADQRLLWALPLIYLVLRGPGAISLDGLLGGLVKRNAWER
ncbi:MAG: DoxX family membrane protein [Rhizobiales bacterium]|nr:DoxX family membrane protein [Hyphomicrobiales bacterium]